MRVHNLPPYVYADRSRHGQVRLYFKRAGAKLRMPDAPGTPDFARAYALALNGQHPGKPGKTIAMTAEGSLEWLCRLYYQSSEFKGWADATRTTKRDVLAQVCREPLDAENPNGATFGQMEARTMPGKALRVLRDRWAGKPAHANNALAILTALYKWAIEAEHATENPARDIRRLKTHSEGYHTWTASEIAAYEAAHPVGTQARLALDLLAYTGVRRSDVVILGPAHLIASEHGTRVVFKAAKNKFSLDIPLLPELAASIAATAIGKETFLLSSLGKPWAISSFSDRFKEWCKEAGLPHCSAHGVRKAGAVLAAEGGATDAEMQALFGWKSQKQAARYRRKADNAKLADKVATTLRRGRGGDKS